MQNNRFSRIINSPHIAQLQELFSKFTSSTRVNDAVHLRSKLDQVLNSYLNPSRENRQTVSKRIQALISADKTSKQRKRSRHTANTRFKNIIIHGLTPAESDPTNEELKKNVAAFFTEKLKVEIQPKSVHRLGENQCKPIRVRLASLEDKKLIYRNCHKLKPFGRQFRITNDYTYLERFQRRPLHALLNEEKKKSNHVKIRNNTLFVNGKARLSTHDEQAIQECLTNPNTGYIAQNYLQNQISSPPQSINSTSLSVTASEDSTTCDSSIKEASSPSAEAVPSDPDRPATASVPQDSAQAPMDSALINTGEIIVNAFPTPSSAVSAPRSPNQCSAHEAPQKSDSNNQQQILTLVKKLCKITTPPIPLRTKRRAPLPPSTPGFSSCESIRPPGPPPQPPTTDTSVKFHLSSPEQVTEE